jgi:hypothetical protein
METPKEHPQARPFVLLSEAGIDDCSLARKSFPLNPLDIIAATGNPIVFLLLLFISTTGGSFAVCFSTQEGLLRVDASFLPFQVL